MTNPNKCVIIQKKKQDPQFKESERITAIMKKNALKNCPVCGNELIISKLKCTDCDIEYTVKVYFDGTETKVSLSPLELKHIKLGSDITI